MMREEEGEKPHVTVSDEETLPVRNIEIYSVKVGDNYSTFHGGDDEHKEREEKEGRLRGVEKVGVEDDEMEVVTDHKKLFQPDDNECVGVDDITIELRSEVTGEYSSEKQNQGDDELGQPHIPQKECILECSLFCSEISCYEAVDGGTQHQEFGSHIKIGPTRIGDRGERANDGLHLNVVEGR